MALLVLRLVFNVLNCLVCHLLPLCQLNPLPQERGRGTTGGMAEVEVCCRGLFLVVFEWVVEFGWFGDDLVVITWLQKCM